MDKLLINGIGCTTGGAKIVLEELLKSYDYDRKIIVVIPIYKNESPIKISNTNIKVIKVNHFLFGNYGRIVLEFIINFYALSNVNRIKIINMSNYGLCLFGKHLLYIHSPHILDSTIKSSFFYNPQLMVKREMLKSYIKNAEAICFQTDHMKDCFQTYLKGKNVKAKILVIRPKPNISIKIESSRFPSAFENELFYPSSGFSHKREDLAIQSISITPSELNIGLSITATTIDGRYNNTRFLGKLSHNQVLAFLKDNTKALLFTSERETLGLPLLEALYFGIPAILPNLPYAREIYGKAAIYFDEPTPESVSKAIVTLFHDYNYYKTVAQLKMRKEWNHRLTWSDHWNYFYSF